MTSLLSMTLLLGLTVGQASATLIPDGCQGGNSGDHDFTLWRANGIDDVQGSPSPSGGFPGTVDIGESIILQTVIDTEDGKCDFEQGTLAHLFPNGTLGSNAISQPPGVAYINGTLGNNQTLQDIYLVTMADTVFTCNDSENNGTGTIVLCSFYGQDNEVDAAPEMFDSVDGVSYSNGFPDETNNISSQRDQFVTLNGNFTVFTVATPRDPVDPTNGTAADVINPSDVVTINGVDNIPGTWAVNATLVTPDSNVTATCDAPVDNTVSYPLDVNCSVSDTFSTPGDYCWNVTIDDNGFLYPTTPIDHVGTFANNECFRILPSWNATTLSNATGTNDEPVTNPLDTVTIVANANFTGTFTGNFTLGNSTNVIETGDCTGGAVNATTGNATLNCQASGTFDTPVGDTCFDVTINAPSPYDPGTFTLFGAEDADNECFKITPPSWNATTLSNATGTQGAPVSNPLDVVTIEANNSFLGTFSGNFTLGNSTNVIETGDCTGGAVNATTGNATLNCQATGPFDEIDGETCFDVTINAPSPYDPIMDTLFGADDRENECFVVNPPEWNATTLANVTGSQSAPVTDPLDVITIVADKDFLGTFNATFALRNSTSDVVDSGDCTGGAVNATTGNATLNCQAIGTFADTEGNTCFDVTIDAPSPYAPGTFTLFGAEDADNECFSITPPEWDAVTFSSATSVQEAEVVDPSDMVVITADKNFLGTFTGNFTLGNSTEVFDSGDCIEGAVNATTGIATLDCQASATIDEIDGETCFDVTINAPSPYTPGNVTLFGAEDADNECFVVRSSIPFDAYTNSTVTGIVGPTINPGDLITINGTDGLFGNFTGNATLTFNFTDAVATTDCSYVNGTTYPLEMDCAVVGEFVEPGEYCWDVTITEITGNYTPSVLNLFGIDDADNECFEVFEGLTPGYWKANAEKWEARAWVEEDPDDDFNTVFSTSVELKIAKGKSALDRGNSTDPTLFGALGARGGDENALSRHCVAAKLNVENPDVEYPYNFTQVITQCGDALDSGNSTAINDLKDLLDEWNNFGANISQHWPN